MDAAELAALMARMPSWEEFLVACGITTSERLVGNCHWAATVLRDLLRTRGVPCRLRRGFWHGDDRRESRAGCAFQQHSWVEARRHRFLLGSDAMGFHRRRAWNRGWRGRPSL
jgi:hypothetical protein